MKPFRLLAFRLLLACCVLAPGMILLPSCASDPEAYARRLEKRNSKYSDYNERRKLRLQARQERTDMWFDRVMGL